MTDQDRMEVHAAIRAAHGAGRFEWVWDRQMAELADVDDQIGKLLLNPEVTPRCWREREGEVVLFNPPYQQHDQAGRYRVVIEEALIGMRTKEGRPMNMVRVPPLPRFAPLVPEPLPIRGDRDDLEFKVRGLLYGH